MRIKLTLSYDGTNYCGWQTQENGISIQQVIEENLFKLTNERIKTVGSGRTDAGVHAEGQVIHFDTNSTIPPEKFKYALNQFLPSDIKAVKSEKVRDDFNACLSAKRKTYAYSMYCSDVELPLKERYAIRVNNLNIDKMIEGAKFLKGEHDFKCFCASGSSVKTTIRTIYQVRIKNVNNEIKIIVSGNGFLYNMVRIIAGTLLKVGENKILPQEIQKILENKNRFYAGKTLPAKGLCLLNVEYK